MKNLIGFIFFFLIVSCRKTNPDTTPKLGIDPGCIQKVYIPSNAYSISPADQKTVNDLFLKNKILNHTYRFYQFKEDTFQTFYPPFLKKDNKNVRAYS